MLVKLKLKNSEHAVLVDMPVYEAIRNNLYFQEVQFLDNLREHSSGCAIFQKYHKKKQGFRVETIYLHKYIAEHFLSKPVSPKKLFVSYINRNPLDCRLKNLAWRTMSELRREQKRTANKTGYRGVIAENFKYRAVIHADGIRYDLGTYDSADEAAFVYNKKSLELFGATGSLNKIPDEIVNSFKSKEKMAV
jgi:hypothetical protein